ncbi:hypothetical protein D7B24_004919 [Verticillium nonalfalfae]|uniref:Uncharacterized protein n=1 Tax=Verticillium nonalfalfae TaxID=1051616 RepID=A0A3M9YGM5_9PEZI|nr:uncharacterized protein D7B24_004919 [Verticillium nonalfalfae]RNJ58280.1 hypothetical protein D7B24_004919 [Verticillium nonalfalfae]
MASSYGARGVRHDNRPDQLLQIDLNTPAKGIRIALAAESAFNIFTAMTMIITPRSALQGQLMPFDLRNGLSQEQASPELASVTQYLGAFVFATNVGLLLGIPNRPGAIDIRRTAYATFAALEITYIVIILWQLCVAGQSATGVRMEKALWAYLVPMSVACGLRLWTLFVRPDWMGRYIIKRTE